MLRAHWDDFKPHLSARQQAWLKKFLVLKFVLMVIATLNPFAHPHIVRQIDTMSVAMRYFSRFFLESDLQYPLLPALLSAGDQYGIAPMELPVLNLLLTPVFALPMPYALYVSRFLFFALCLGVGWWHHKAWSKHSDSFLPVSSASLMVLFFSVSSIYLHRFMPDVLAFLFVSLSTAYSWTDLDWKKSLPLLAIGTLMKPPAVVALAIYLLKPKFWRSFKHASWVIPGIFITGLYYTLGMDFIKSVSDLPPYFKVQATDPLAGLMGVFTQPGKILDILNTSVFTRYLFFPNLVLSLVWLKKGIHVGYQIRLWLILLLQIIAVAMLDGVHSFHHHYYFVGVSMVACLLTLVNLQGLSYAFKWLFLSVIVITSIEFHWYEVRPLFKPNPSYLAQCQDLKSRNPEFPWGQAYRFGGPQINPPRLGLCFGEIQGSQTSEFGFWWRKLGKNKGKIMDPRCAVVDQSSEILLVRCPPSYR